MNEEMVLVLDFGGQYNQLIARRVRECGVYSEIKPYKTPAEEIRKMSPVGIIFTGGPSSVYADGAPKCDPAVFELGIPILGICYGTHILSHMLGGKVAPAGKREYGKTDIQYNKDCAIFEGLPENAVCWMSHTDCVERLPEGFAPTAVTSTCTYAAMEDKARRFFGVQFHPEVAHTENGTEIIRNFLFKVCGCKGDWKMSSYAERLIAEIREKVGDGKVLLALSGGVDSSVCAALMHKAVGDRLTCIFVDHGFMRKNEADEVEEVFSKQFGTNLVMSRSADRFLNKLAGVSDPERKRKLIGEEFIKVFEQEAKRIGKVDFLCQGTIYPDVIESGLGDAAVIKSHHNVGGLPDHVDFREIVEPLRHLFKDEVRRLGEALGLPRHMVWRQPFPGPGLAIRIIGDITKEKLDILRDADAVFRQEIAAAGMDASVNQYFAVLTNMRTVGVMGDERTYDYTLALRAVTTGDFMTADWARIPYELLEKVSGRIVNEVGHINRVVYDITSKPPATIEWE